MRLPNRHNRGFTLVELMVVIAILITLVSVLAFAVIPAISDSTTQLDTVQLGKFKTDFDMAVSIGSSARRVVNVDNEGGTSAQFFCRLFEKDILSLETMGRLAGASGTKGSENDYKNLSNLNTGKNGMIIFTGPTNGQNARSHAGGKAKDGIFMCYNESNLALDEKELVAVICGESQAVQINYKDFKDTFGQYGQVPDSISPEKPDFYGSFPFEHVAPK